MGFVFIWHVWPNNLNNVCFDQKVAKHTPTCLVYSCNLTHLKQSKNGGLKKDKNYYNKISFFYYLHAFLVLKI